MRFAQRLLALQGKFVYAENVAELGEFLQQAAGTVQPSQIHCLEPSMQEILSRCNFAFAQSEPGHPGGASDEALR
ncbi:MAG: hypothetical protein EBS08_01905, partial [Cytophagia bacterium]|nr:hypothetical protein [Cytophagia bacterium]